MGRLAYRVTAACVMSLIAATGAVAIGRASAGHAGYIAPKQYFTATVNGRTGHPNPVVIRMACFGPIRPGQTGHPMSGQTVAVARVYPSSSAGYTGNRGTSIGAFFGAPPPGTPSSSTGYVRFTFYGSKPIPTSLELPCAGSGRVSFVPLPVDPTSRDVTVPVSFVGQP